MMEAVVGIGFGALLILSAIAMSHWLTLDDEMSIPPRVRLYLFGGLMLFALGAAGTLLTNDDPFGGSSRFFAEVLAGLAALTAAYAVGLATGSIHLAVRHRRH